MVAVYEGTRDTLVPYGSEPVSRVHFRWYRRSAARR
jgi:hypothetical protein